MEEITLQDVINWLRNTASDDEVHQIIVEGQRAERARRRATLNDPAEIAREVFEIQNVTLTNRTIGIRELSRLLSATQPHVIIMHTLDEVHFVIVSSKERSIWAGKPAYGSVQIGELPTERLVQLISETKQRAWSVLQTYRGLKLYQTEAKDIFDALAEYLAGQNH